MKRRRHKSAAFTMIELLVAMTILAIVILGMAQVFHQSSVAWDSGLRNSRGNMTARAVLLFMAGELREAAAYGGDPQPKLTAGLTPPSNLYFTKLSIVEDGGVHRAAHRITYKLENDSIVRVVQKINPSGPDEYGLLEAGTTSVLATNVNALVFTPPPDDDFGPALPAWIQVRVGIPRRADVSGLGVTSFGRDGQPGTEDDIQTY